MKVLVACEFSGIVRDAFRARGHDAWSCDLLPTEREGPHYQEDVLKIIPLGWDLMIAHPPCTYLTVTGNKWFNPKYNRNGFAGVEERLRFREEALTFFFLLATAPVPKICVENPIGVVSTRWRKPDQVIQPYQFGHVEAKATCLWLKNLPKLEQTKEVEPDYVTLPSGKRMARWYAESFGKEDAAKIRSRTFQGIANAMAEQWG